MSNINCMRCSLDGQDFDCERALNLEQSGAVGVRPRTTVWSQGRWNFVQFNHATGQYGYWRRESSFIGGQIEAATGDIDGVVSFTRNEQNTWVNLQFGVGRRYDFFGHGWRRQTTHNPIEIINTGGDTAFEEHKDKILDLISRMTDPNGPCAAAFKRAGLPTPGDIVKKGLILGSRKALTDAAYNEALGLTNEARLEYNKSQANAMTINGSRRGKTIILFTGSTFTDNQYLEDVPHEFIHAAGMGKWRFDVGHPSPFLSWGHDLSHFPPYQDIINNCK